jgi:hypothetical protein
MSTVFLALGLLISLGIITFALSLGLTGLGVLLSWILPLSPFQGTLVHLALFVLAIFFLGLTLLVERVKDSLMAAAAEEEGPLDEVIQFGEHDGRHARRHPSLPDHPTETKVGRNDPCPCGSGKKYKFCCLMRA